MPELPASVRRSWYNTEYTLSQRRCTSTKPHFNDMTVRRTCNPNPGLQIALEVASPFSVVEKLCSLETARGCQVGYLLKGRNLVDGFHSIPSPSVTETSLSSAN